jgi:cytochrome c oxidase subunit III
MSHTNEPFSLRSASPAKPPPTLATRAGTVAMVLFLISLGMLFTACMLGYVLIRIHSEKSPPLGAINIPLGLCFSTLLVLAGSVTMHFAVRDVHRERLADLRQWLLTTLGIAIAFLLLQAVFLSELLRQDHVARSQGVVLYALIFFLVLVHGLHVVGGVVALALVYVGARMGRYDHEHFFPVRNAALYWHFLDGVWLTMFTIFLILR